MPIGAKFAVLHRAFRRELDAALKEKDLTGVQFGVLRAIDRLERTADGEISQRAVEEASHSSHPTMCEILKKLEKKGFVDIRPSRTDGRRKTVGLTDRARELDRELFGVDERTFARIACGLDEAQTEALGAMLDTMLSNICGCGAKEE